MHVSSFPVSLEADSPFPETHHSLRLGVPQNAPPSRGVSAWFLGTLVCSHLTTRWAAHPVSVMKTLRGLQQWFVLGGEYRTSFC